jgi:hypothetical protein
MNDDRFDGPVEPEHVVAAPRPLGALFPKSPQPDAQLLSLIGSSLSRVKELPPSRGYEPLLIENGIHPVLARGIAFLAVRSGGRLARESRRRRPVFDAIRFLAKPRQKRAILARAKTILAAWNETSIIETLFDEIGLEEFEFIRLLESIISEESLNYCRLTEIAALVEPHLSLSRGPKVSAWSASHGLLLEHKIELTATRLPHSRKDRTAENCDALTESTRREFAEPCFDSRPAKVDQRNLGRTGHR